MIVDAFGVAQNFGMLWKQWGFLTSSGQPIKNGKQVVELLDAIQQLRQLTIIKIPGHSKAVTMEAQGNHLADAAAKWEALNGQIVQTWECSLLPIKSIKDSLPTDGYRRRKEDMATKRGNLQPGQADMAWIQPVLLIGVQLPILQHLHELTHWDPERWFHGVNNITGNLPV